MKKTVALILAIVLSLALFCTNIAGITLVTRAADTGEEETSETALGSGDEQGGEEDEDEEEEEEEKQEEEKKEEKKEEEKKNDEEEQRKQEEQQKKEEEEQARKEEEERKKEEERRAAEEREAEEARKRQEEEDEAAREAKRKAQEEQEAAEKKAEEERKAAEEAKKKAEEQKYKLSVSTSSVKFGTATVGTHRDTQEITIMNTGSTTVEVVPVEQDPDNAFYVELYGQDNVLQPGSTIRYTINMRADLPANNYQARLIFTDVGRDPYGTTDGTATVSVTGSVTPKEAVVTGVTITPNRATLAVGNEYQFFAKVNSSNGEVLQDVIWTVMDQRSSKTNIASNGTLSIAKDETAATLTVMATSMADRSISGRATVTTQRNSYNVSTVADPKKGGSISGGGAVSQGGSVTLSAVPNKNYYFTGWVREGKVVSKDTNYTINNIQSNIKVTAKFEQNYVTVKVEPNDKNAGTVVGGGKVRYDGATTLSAKAYDGYVFTGWKEGDKIINREAAFELSGIKHDHDIKAIFEKTSHKLTLASDPKEGGKTEGGGVYKLNQSATIKATPASGYVFDNWQVNGHIVSRDATLKIDKVEKDCTFTAIFLRTGAITHEMSAGVATTGGTISPSGKLSVEQGSTLTYTITPKAGFAILAVAVDDRQVGPVGSYTFSDINAPHTISAAFVQTDAGRSNAEAAGKEVQPQKVQPVEKTEENTATAETTVKVEEAIVGEVEDVYVEEMDLTDIVIPSDEELGITYEEESYSEVATMMGMTASEARALVSSGNTMPVLDAAFYAGMLEANVTNAMEPSGMTSIDYSGMTAEELMQVSDDVINPSLPNLDVVVQKMLSTDEVITFVDGAYGNISVSLTKLDKPYPLAEVAMQKAIGYKPVQHFDLTMVKSIDGYAQTITQLPTGMEVVIEIPDEVYKKGKNYSVLRVHDGEVRVLPDLDDDPKTITFRTDRFSPYAIAEEVASSNQIILWFAIGAAVTLAIALTCMIILMHHQAKLRRARRRARIRRDFD